MGERELREKLSRLEGFLAVDSENVSLRADIAELHYQLGEFDPAREMFSSLLEDTKNALYAFKLASVEIAANNQPRALELLNGLLDSGVDNPGVRFNIGYSSLLNQDPETALAQADTLLNSGEGAGANIHLLKARALHHLERMAEGVETLQQHIDDQPDDVESLGVLSIMHWDNDDTDNAEAVAYKTLELQPENDDAHVTLGSIALEQQDPDGALEHFSGVVSRRPNNGRAWSGLAYAEMLNLNLDAAKAHFESAVQYMPNHIGTWHGLGWIQILQDDLDGAEESFKKSLELDRSFGETHGGLAVIAALRDQLDIASTSAKKAVRLDKETFAGRFARTLVASKRGRKLDAQVGMREITEPLRFSKGRDLAQVMQGLVERKLAEKTRDMTDAANDD